MGLIQLLKKQRISFRSLLQLAGIMTLIFSFAACKKETTIKNIPLVGPEQEFYALSNNSLIRYNAKSVKFSIAQNTISGIGVGEKLWSMDFRPATGELYALSDAGKIYIINLNATSARVVTNTPLLPALEGTAASMAFEPSTDRIRIITNTGQNLKVNPETATVETVDAPVGNATTMAIAYNNSTAGTNATVLYTINPLLKKLYQQNPATAVRTEVGNLNQDLGTMLSFDISADNKNALAIGKVGDSTKLFVINLSNGNAEIKGKFPINSAIQSIAMPANPVIYATDNNNNLLIINPSSDADIISKGITGLQVGETILGIDMRPSKGQLFALGSSSRLYTINLGSGAATQVGNGMFTTTLVGNSFGFDFNPLADAIRVVSNTGQNLRLNPNTAAVTVDAPLSAGAAVSAAAYSNNFSGTTSTTLFVIDHILGKLYSQEPNSGVLTAIGDLKIQIQENNGFDIVSTTGNVAYGIFKVAGKTGLYRIELSSGVATAIGELGTVTITGFTLGLRF